jgi:hypothetical protein
VQGSTRAGHQPRIQLLSITTTADTQAVSDSHVRHASTPSPDAVRRHRKCDPVHISGKSHPRFRKLANQFTPPQSQQPGHIRRNVLRSIPSKRPSNRHETSEQS